MIINETPTKKGMISNKCNYLFDKTNGYTYLWGEDYYDDPIYSPDGPLILDMELTTICNFGCPHCYKNNGPSGKYMSFERFKRIFHKLPKTLTQIAFGMDWNLSSNPDWVKIFEYCRDNSYQEIVPNVTLIHDDSKSIDILSRLCGAISISYTGLIPTYQQVERFLKKNIQTNIQFLLHENSFQEAIKLAYYIKKHPKTFNELHSVTFLSLKKCGRAENNQNYISINPNNLKRLIDKYVEFNIPIGFDSCFSHRIKPFIPQQYHHMIEPCEASLFSLYCNVNGEFFPCSFLEHHQAVNRYFIGGLTLRDDFQHDVWHQHIMSTYRNWLLQKNRCCLHFQI